MSYFYDMYFMTCIYGMHSNINEKKLSKKSKYHLPRTLIIPSKVRSRTTYSHGTCKPYTHVPFLMA